MVRLTQETPAADRKVVDPGNAPGSSLTPADKKNLVSHVTTATRIRGHISARWTPKAPTALAWKLAWVRSWEFSVKKCCADERVNALCVSSKNAGWSSLVARQAHNLKVAGSNPAPATTSYDFSEPGFQFLRSYRQDICIGDSRELRAIRCSGINCYLSPRDTQFFCTIFGQLFLDSGFNLTSCAVGFFSRSRRIGGLA